ARAGELVAAELQGTTTEAQCPACGTQTYIRGGAQHTAVDECAAAIVICSSGECQRASAHLGQRPASFGLRDFAAEGRARIQGPDGQIGTPATENVRPVTLD